MDGQAGSSNSAGPSGSVQLRNRPKGQLEVIEAPETGRFNSPLPNSAGDTRQLKKLKDREPKFMDMTGRRGAKRATPADEQRDDNDDEGEDELSEDEDGRPKRKWANKRNATSTGRRKISIQYIDDKSKRHVSFTKRKAGLMKKAYELSTLTGTNCLVLVVSETGLVYTYSTPGLKPVIAHPDGKQVISKALKGELKLEGDDASGSGGAAQDPEDGGGDILMGMGLGDDNVQQQQTASTSKSAMPRRTSSSSSQHSLPDLPNLPSLIEQLPQIRESFSAQGHNQVSGGMIDDPALRFLSDESYGLFNGRPSSSASLFPPTSFAQTALSVTATSSASSYSAGLSAAFPASFSLAPPTMPLTSSPLPPSTTSLPQAPTLPPAVSAHDKPAAVPQTAYQRAAAEHAQAFAQYQAQTTAPVLRSGGYPLAESSSLVPTASKSPLHGAHEFWGAAKGWVQPASATNGEGTIEERRRSWKEAATRALEDARLSRKISAFVNAHSLSYKASQAIPPLKSATSQSSPIELVLTHFGDMCSSNSVDSLDKLEIASGAFLHNYIPAHPEHTQKMTNEAKQYMTLFFDFLEGHTIITPAQHEALTAFPAPRQKGASNGTAAPATNTSTSPAVDTAMTNTEPTVVPASDDGESPTASTTVPVPDPASPTRQDAVATGLCRWTTDVTNIYYGRLASEHNADGRVEGWLDVWRLGRSYALLKSQDNDNPNAQRLSPFKVRMPLAVTQNLRRNDSLYLELRRVQGASKETWVPVVSGPFDGSRAPSSSSPPDDGDPDLTIELALARTDLDSAASGEATDKARQQVELVERARRLLGDGEFDA